MCFARGQAKQREASFFCLNQGDVVTSRNGRKSKIGEKLFFLPRANSRQKLGKAFIRKSCVMSCHLQAVLRYFFASANLAIWLFYMHTMKECNYRLPL